MEIDLFQCQFPNELTLRPGISGQLRLRLPALVIFGIDVFALFYQALFVDVVPTVLLTVSCPDRPQYSADVLTTPLLALGASPYAVYYFELPTTTATPAAVAAGGSTACTVFATVANGPSVYGRNSTVAPTCTETTVDAGVEPTAACTGAGGDIGVGVLNTDALTVGLQRQANFSSAAFPGEFFGVLQCTATGVTVVENSTIDGTAVAVAFTEVLLSQPPAPAEPSVVVSLQLRRDIVVGQSLGCRLSVYESLGASGSVRREYVSRRRDITCATATLPPPRETAVQQASCGPLVLGTENVDALGVTLCRAVNDGRNITVGVRFNCTDPARYHAPQGRNVQFETFAATGPANECRRVAFSLVLSGARSALRNDVVCTFQGVDTIGNDDVGALSRASAPCTSESLRSSAPQPVAPTPVPAPTPSPLPPPTPPPNDNIAGIPRAGFITIAVCVALGVAYLIFFIVRAVRSRPRSVDIDSARRRRPPAAAADDRRPLLPTTASSTSPATPPARPPQPPPPPRPARTDLPSQQPRWLRGEIPSRGGD